MLLYLDIETLPCSDPDVIATLAETIKAPGTHKKPETIAAWMEENKESALKELVSKTSFDGLYGSIACICYAFDDGDVFSVDCNTAGSEASMLEQFYSHMAGEIKITYHGGTTNRDVTMVGHNLAGFDLPFIKHRSMILEVKPDPAMLKAMKAKPWDTCIADTMLMWSSDSQKRVSMDKLCKAFGLAGKGDFDGSMVAETWPVDPQRVVCYCADDVRRTREIYKRLTWA